jgi:hypothetical protein
MGTHRWREDGDEWMTDPTGLPPTVTGTRLGTVIAALAADWPAVLAGLDRADRDALIALIDDADRLDQAMLLRRLEDLLVRADLPAGSAVADYLAKRNRLVAAPLATIEMRGALHWARRAIAAQTITSTSRVEVFGRLAAVPAYSPSEIVDAGGDPARPELIRLRVGGQVRLPRFQFAPNGSAREAVCEVNRILDAENDPWGVVSWWLDRHAWLDGVPVEFIEGGERQRRLVAAAQAELVD